MLDPDSLLTIGVFPVLVGPLQTLLALLPAILLALGSMLLALFRPGGLKKLLKFCWRQKYFLLVVIGAGSLFKYEIQPRLSFGRSHREQTSIDAGTSEWSSALGGPRRLGRGPGDSDATAPGLVWENSRDGTILSSPAVVGNLVVFSTATDIGPFTPEGHGAIVCVNAQTGAEVWRYAPSNYRASFSSPVVAGDCVVCGEGLHQVEDARVTCLDLQSGQRRWEFRTHSHVESTAAIADGRVFIGAGSDGFYCLSLEADAQGQAQVLWHLESSEFIDCESSPAVVDGVVYFGLGEGGTALCAVQADDGKLLWKLPTPYPVFAPPTIVNGKLYLATGNGNYVQSASDLLAMKLQILQDDGATQQQLAEAAEKYKAVGEVWCVDLNSRTVDWKFSTSDAVLGAVAGASDGIYFGSRDRHVYKLSRDGSLVAKYDLQGPVVTSTAVGTNHVYGTTATGRLFCLDAVTLTPIWDAGLGGGETFSSSPVIAHGHVYLGTARHGLQCLGRPGDPPVPAWNGGDRGGSADDVPVIEDPVLVWQYPSDEESEFRVTAPMMPFLDSLFLAGNHEGQTRVIRLNPDAPDDKQRLEWSQKFAGTIRTALVGSGDLVCIVEESPDGSSQTVHALSARDGTTRWQHSVSAPVRLTKQRMMGIPPGIAISSKYVFIWENNGALTALDFATGEAVWDQRHADTIAAPGQNYLWDRGWSSPTPANDLVFALTLVDSTVSFSVAAIDAGTGTTLWRSRLRHPPRRAPLVDGHQLLVECSEEVSVHSILDGKHLRSLATSDVPAFKTLPAPDENQFGQRITPVVSLKGRLLFATERGKIICLGESP